MFRLRYEFLNWTIQSAKPGQILRQLVCSHAYLAFESLGYLFRICEIFYDFRQLNTGKKYGIADSYIFTIFPFQILGVIVSLYLNICALLDEKVGHSM